jgi:thiol-disulfide isomerase/thioredoxin
MPHESEMDPDVPNEFRRESHAGKVLIGLLLLALGVTLLSWFISPGNGLLKSHGPAPSITAAGWVNGAAPTKESLAGKVVLIDVWATWCGPCLRAMPHMVELHDQFADRGVVFIGLTSEGEEDQAKIQSVLQKADARWPTGWGAIQTMRDLHNEFLPCIYVIGKNGQIMWTTEDGGDLPQVLEQLLK